jgi:hypothetical protein
MCHERWVRHSEDAVQRAWLRGLSKRDAEVGTTLPVSDPAAVDDDVEAAFEPAMATPERQRL